MDFTFTFFRCDDRFCPMLLRRRLLRVVGILIFDEAVIPRLRLLRGNVVPGSFHAGPILLLLFFVSASGQERKLDFDGIPRRRASDVGSFQIVCVQSSLPRTGLIWTVQGKLLVPDVSNVIPGAFFFPFFLLFLRFLFFPFRLFLLRFLMARGSASLSSVSFK